MDSVPMIRKVYVVPDSVHNSYLNELSKCCELNAWRGEKYFIRCWILVGLRYASYIPVHWYRPPYTW